VSERPQALPVIADNIPNDLVTVPHWVAWRYVEDVDKKTGEISWDKPPVNVRTGKLASSTDPGTWCAFPDAIKYMRRHKFDGIGFVLHRTADQGDAPGLVGIDLDHCRDAETGKVEPWAREIIESLNTYTEVSPSGQGLRAFLFGKLPPSGRKKGPIEMYEHARYVTVTGHKLDGLPS
jgi:primase-polymerase (primpol)-like protein